MAVRCVFYTPGESESCQVLKLAGASPAMAGTRRKLADRYCRTGRFIACPVFNRVERGLTEANRKRAAAWSAAAVAQSDITETAAAS